MRFLTRHQYIELIGQAECERQLDRARRRGLPEPDAEGAADDRVDATAAGPS